MVGQPAPSASEWTQRSLAVRDYSLQSLYRPLNRIVDRVTLPAVHILESGQHSQHKMQLSRCFYCMTQRRVHRASPHCIKTTESAPPRVVPRNTLKTFARGAPSSLLSHTTFPLKEAFHVMLNRLITSLRGMRRGLILFWSSGM